MLRLSQLSLTMGEQDLLLDVDWHLRPGAHAGLIGRNGTGKSTLLRAIMRQVSPASGHIHLRGDARVAYLPQQALSGSVATVWDEARSQMAWLEDFERRLASAQAAAESGAPGAAEDLALVTEQMALCGAFAAEQRIGEVLNGLGFSTQDWQRGCDSFSGGWQMRIALARLLLSDPKLLLLDEPTNHLDVATRSWLADYLAASSATMIVVSHDRHLLDAACTETVELRDQGLHSFAGNLSAWIAERAVRQASLLDAKKKQDQQIARLERFVDRFGAKANKAAQARSKQKAIDRIERVEAPRRQGRPRLRLPDAPPGALVALTLRGVDLGWPDGPVVVGGVDLVLERGMRLAVLGPNGCGKSTLLGGLFGSIHPRAGRRVLGRDIRVARYAQDLAQELPADQTAIEAVQAQVPLAPTARVRAALGALGLVGDAQLRRVGLLSGGEKARIVLAGFACRPANLLLLDEPSNHLDAVTVEVLAEALAEFEGTIVLVTHDRWLVEQVATHVAHVGAGRVQLHAGVRPDDFLPPQRRTGSDGAETQSRTLVGEGREDWQDRKARQRDLDRARKRLRQVHQEIEAAEQDLAQLDASMAEVATDHLALAALAQQRSALSQRIEARYQEWETLEAIESD
ncbi:MAG: ABC-F family ATP-binding cassette domain-containing protein [Oligoflexia bacterium]|nr:ABC-F family ATP-binding cassette domain-containing protein [Oligoflexia bacterium]